MREDTVVRLGPREIASSVALQKTIFFNTWFSISWFICTIGILARKYMKGLTLVDPDEVRTIFLVLFMIFEPLRLTAGYYGNLKEQVPLLMALILLSVFPTMPACFYMLAAQYHLKPYQLALQVPQMAFLLASTGFGARALASVYSLGRRQRAFKTGSQGRSVAQNGSKWNTSALFDDDATAAMQQGSTTLRAGSVSANGGISTQIPPWNLQEGAHSPNHTS